VRAARGGGLGRKRAGKTGAAALLNLAMGWAAQHESPRTNLAEGVGVFTLCQTWISLNSEAIKMLSDV